MAKYCFVTLLLIAPQCFLSCSSTIHSKQFGEQDAQLSLELNSVKTSPSKPNNFNRAETTLKSIEDIDEALLKEFEDSFGQRVKTTNSQLSPGKGLLASGRFFETQELPGGMSPRIARYRRAVHYRARCCYVDVMCSRGCRIPVTPRHLAKRSVESSRTTHRILSNSKQSNDIDNVKIRFLKDKDSSRPAYLPRESDKGHGFIPSKTGGDSGTRLNNDKASSSSLFDSLYRHDKQSTSHEILQELPTILDSLEYLMKHDISTT